MKEKEFNLSEKIENGKEFELETNFAEWVAGKEKDGIKVHGVMPMPHYMEPKEKDKLSGEKLR